MANLGFHLLLLFLSFHYNLTSATAADHPPTISTTNFIEAACKTTRYYTLCIQSLSSYSHTIQQSDQQLARAALAVTLNKAQSTANFVAKLSKSSSGGIYIKPRESQALKDCIDNMVDSVDQLNQSMEEMGRLGNRVSGQNFIWHMSNVQTWVSAALTDENTCLDGFSGPDLSGNLKGVIRRRIVYVAQVTSNALALVNRFADTHRPGSTSNHSP
ncbi:hypothetical protein ACH5RR_038607 [Cinchona calisaya]|uniref:Pectinesterase inhibitor domain-containing protein n=1 Tax=Cinchona calisaya TaxID=153742 RepID=A0ABD2XVS6_9GENT